MTRTTRWLVLFLLTTGLSVSIATVRAAKRPFAPMWSEEPSLLPTGLADDADYRLLRVDLNALQTTLARAPLELSAIAPQEETILPLPMPDGSTARFRIYASPIMEAELAAKFPHIETYLAQGIDDPAATGRLDLTPAGFHAMILSPSGTILLDPVGAEMGKTAVRYLSYYKNDWQEAGAFREYPPLANAGATMSAATSSPRQFTQLRVYRLALATTGEYTQYHGGSVADGLGAAVTAVNRVNAIYERETAVRLALVSGNETLIFTNPATDPYDNDNPSAMLEQNKIALNQRIGSANYDIGHVFGRNSGGLAYLNAACDADYKAGGVTGLPNPEGDPFYVDYVAHELGHQLGANHTFNGDESNCAIARHAPTAYEPGSGSAIMAYAGICGAQNLQPHSDDYFHAITLAEIDAYVNEGGGSVCGELIGPIHENPVVDAGVGGFTIPKETPFTLTGSATDAEGGALTYVWEEFDLGPSGAPTTPSASAPLFRSFLPVASPSRTFPQLADVIGNRQTIGELLPVMSRELTFRLTARDNQGYPAGGGTGSDTIAFQVTESAGPFRVVVPNTAVVWQPDTVYAVLWDVANTNQEPVRCTAVNISLSLDGGWTYPLLLAVNEPNDGGAMVVAPDQFETAVRLKVACADNVFFDISDVDFRLEGAWAYQTFLPLAVR